MMSSEEDPESGLLTAAEQSLSSKCKTKRVRQRVDAGEPRNSYASIPNFSSRPPHLAALYGNGFAASKMLCDLLGSGSLNRTTTINNSKDSDNNMIVLDCNGTSPGRIFMNGGSGGGDMLYDSSGGESSNSHLLRDILQQGRSRGGGETVASGHGPESPGEVSFRQEKQQLDDDEDSNDSSKESCNMSATVRNTSPPPTQQNDEGSSRGSSPGGAPWQQQPLPNTDSSLEVKRARVETIVSNMLQGPTPRTNGNGGGLADNQPPVNGCKKRKLYQPQQHESNRPTTNGDAASYDEDDEEEFREESSSPVIKRRNTNVVASNGDRYTFRQQLRHMQQQLVAMKQQYMEMVDGDSTDEEPPQRTASDSEIDLKLPPKTEPPFVDYDNASMYDNEQQQQRSGRLVIDDRKEPDTPSKTRQSCIVQTTTPLNVDYEWLAESLKAELSTSLSQVVDAVVSRCAQRKAALSKVTAPVQPQEQTKDPTLLSQMLDRKSPRTGKVIDRGTRVNGALCGGLRTSPYPPDIAAAPKPPFFFPLKPPSSVAATAAFLYGSPPQLPSMSSLSGGAPYGGSPARSTPTPQDVPEQTEAMSLVVSSKKKRHKVTDTRLHQRPICGLRSSADSTPSQDLSPKYSDTPLPPIYHHPPPPPPLVPVSLPTTVAIPNPSLNQSELFHNFSYEHHRLSQHFAALDSGPPDDDDRGPPMHHSGALHHPLMSFHHQRGSPDFSHVKQQDSGDMSDTGDSPATYDSNMAMISFLPSSMHTSTLTPMHLRKAKLMFFFARYPSSAVLKMYFPDIRFNKNNTAQLVKWFSNFREFFYIQMEKYARQAITEGVKSAEDLKVNTDSELLRVLNLHYNRNNHIPSPEQFRYVVEQTLREFYKALVAGKDSEQSWKKSIYKIIARLDDSVPDYFKSPNFLDTLE